MNFLPKEIGQDLIDEIQVIHSDKDLVALERVLKLRQLQETLFKELTHDENILFSTLHSRESYHFTNYPSTPIEIQRDLKSTRILANKIIHGQIEKPSSIQIKSLVLSRLQ